MVKLYAFAFQELSFIRSHDTNYLFPFFTSLKYFETSAATGQNVSKAIECLLDQIMVRMEKSVDNAQFAKAKGGKTLSAEKEEDSSGKCAC